MAFQYKNPISSSQLNTVESVSRIKTYGTNFSVLQVGGYMEVYTLNDLVYTVPEGSTGPIEFSGNTIPVNYSVRTLSFLPDTLILNSDNISSGRRRLGMLVYVHETQQTYQYTIPNFETLWDGASGSTTINQYGTSVTTSTAGGGAFIDAWLDSSIEGVGGVTRDNARWKIFYGTDITVTGGTYNSGNGTLTMTNTTGGTFNVTGITSSNIANSNLTLDDNRVLTLDGNDLEILGGSGERLQLTSTELILSAATSGNIVLKGLSSSSNTNYLVIDANGNVSFNTSGGEGSTAISGITYDSEWGLNEELTDGSSSTTQLPFITGGTYFGSDITLKIAGGLESDIVISGPESIDTYVTGGTFSNGNLELVRNDSDVISITGFNSDDTYLTGATYTPTTLTLGMSDDTLFNVTGFSPTITGGTYSAGTISLLDNTGGQVNITGISQADISIYNSDGQLTGRRVVDQSGNDLVFSGGSVSMGSNTTSPACALLELASENQGLLIPRMTQEQRLAIDTPLPGLLVYCTNTDGNGQEGMYMYKSNGWVNVL